MRKRRVEVVQADFCEAGAADSGGPSRIPWIRAGETGVPAWDELYTCSRPPARDPVPLSYTVTSLKARQPGYLVKP